MGLSRGLVPGAVRSRRWFLPVCDNDENRWPGGGGGGGGGVGAKNKKGPPVAVYLGHP